MVLSASVSAASGLVLAATRSSNDGGSSGTSLIITVVFVIAVLLIVAAVRRSRARVAQRHSVPLTPGTEVVTRAGMFGTVREVSERELVVEVAPGVLVRMLPTAAFSRAQVEAEDRRRGRRTLGSARSGSPAGASPEDSPDEAGGSLTNT